jgi:hypothetical protein
MPLKHPAFARRITIGSYYTFDDQPVITKNQISSLKECTLNYKQPMTYWAYWDLYDNDPEAPRAEISEMYMITEGNKVKIYYKTPSRYMERLVNKDTLKFEGTKNGPRYQGKAYVFTKYCRGESFGYDVSGGENDDQTLITLRGPAPVINVETCEIHRLKRDSKNSTLNFKAQISPEQEITVPEQEITAKRGDKNIHIH